MLCELISRYKKDNIPFVYNSFKVYNEHFENFKETITYPVGYVPHDKVKRLPSCEKIRMNFGMDPVEFRTLFKPIASIQSCVDEFYDKYKRDGENWIGVHMRRTDFQTPKKRKLFFKEDIYLDAAKHIKKKYLNNNGRFIVFSDDRRIKEIFPKDTVYVVPEAYRKIQTTLARTDDLVDLFKMALCDTILSSNSTFSRFAATYNNIDRYQIKRIVDTKKRIQLFKNRVYVEDIKVWGLNENSKV